MAEETVRSSDGLSMRVLTTLVGLAQANEIVELETRIEELAQRVMDLGDQLDRMTELTNRVFGTTVSDRVDFQLNDLRRLVEKISIKAAKLK